MADICLLLTLWFEIINIIALCRERYLYTEHNGVGLLSAFFVKDITCCQWKFFDLPAEDQSWVKPERIPFTFDYVRVTFVNRTFRLFSHSFL